MLPNNPFANNKGNKSTDPSKSNPYIGNVNRRALFSNNPQITPKLSQQLPLREIMNNTHAPLATKPQTFNMTPSKAGINTPQKSLVQDSSRPGGEQINAISTTSSNNEVPASGLSNSVTTRKKSTTRKSNISTTSPLKSSKTLPSIVHPSPSRAKPPSSTPGSKILPQHNVSQASKPSVITTPPRRNPTTADPLTPTLHTSLVKLSIPKQPQKRKSVQLGNTHPSSPIDTTPASIPIPKPLHTPQFHSPVRSARNINNPMSMSDVGELLDLHDDSDPSFTLGVISHGDSSFIPVSTPEQSFSKSMTQKKAGKNDRMSFTEINLVSDKFTQKIAKIKGNKRTGKQTPNSTPDTSRNEKNQKKVNNKNNNNVPFVSSTQSPIIKPTSVKATMNDLVDSIIFSSPSEKIACFPLIYSDAYTETSDDDDEIIVVRHVPPTPIQASASRRTSLRHRGNNDQNDRMTNSDDDFQFIKQVPQTAKVVKKPKNSKKSPKPKKNQKSSSSTTTSDIEIEEGNSNYPGGICVICKHSIHHLARNGHLESHRRYLEKEVENKCHLCELGFSTADALYAHVNFSKHHANAVAQGNDDKKPKKMTGKSQLTIERPTTVTGKKGETTKNNRPIKRITPLDQSTDTIWGVKPDEDRSCLDKHNITTTVIPGRILTRRESVRVSAGGIVALNTPKNTKNEKKLDDLKKPDDKDEENLIQPRRRGRPSKKLQQQQQEEKEEEEFLIEDNTSKRLTRSSSKKQNEKLTVEEETKSSSPKRGRRSLTVQLQQLTEDELEEDSIEPLPTRTSGGRRSKKQENDETIDSIPTKRVNKPIYQKLEKKITKNKKKVEPTLPTSLTRSSRSNKPLFFDVDADKTLDGSSTNLKSVSKSNTAEITGKKQKKSKIIPEKSIKSTKTQSSTKTIEKLPSKSITKPSVVPKPSKIKKAVVEVMSAPRSTRRSAEPLFFDVTASKVSGGAFHSIVKGNRRSSTTRVSDSDSDESDKKISRRRSTSLHQKNTQVDQTKPSKNTPSKPAQSIQMADDEFASEVPVKRPRGRPPRISKIQMIDENHNENEEQKVVKKGHQKSAEHDAAVIVPVKRSRGRPPLTNRLAKKQDEEAVPVKRGRGRPRLSIAFAHEKTNKISHDEASKNRTSQVIDIESVHEDLPIAKRLKRIPRKSANNSANEFVSLSTNQKETITTPQKKHTVKVGKKSVTNVPNKTNSGVYKIYFDQDEDSDDLFD